jgi:hypothetical protein
MEECVCREEATRVYDAAVKEDCSGLDDEADYVACERPHYDLLQK